MVETKQKSKKARNIIIAVLVSIVLAFCGLCGLCSITGDYDNKITDTPTNVPSQEVERATEMPTASEPTDTPRLTDTPMSTNTSALALITTIFLLVFAIIGIAILAYLLFQKRQQLKRYQGIFDVEAEQRRIQKENQSLTNDNEKLKKEGRVIRDVVTDLKSQLAGLEDEQGMQEFGLYKPKYDFGTSAGYKAKVDEIRQHQKKLIKDKKAIIWGTQWEVQGSKAKGRTMMNRLTRLTLRAFNGECDSIIIKVKYNNVDRIKDRIERVYEAINKLNASQNCRINPKYLDSKAQELYVVHEYQEKLQAEKEEQRQIREQMREEQRAQKELEKAQHDAEKEEEQYQKALDKARKEMEQATGEKQSELKGEIERLNQMLTEANEKKERAISRAQMTKSGHVYIISNIGSFGENIYKIGLTRRLVPMDRVKELGDASVPFLFDVHAMIYSDDAPALENHLHKTFDSRRVNLVNSRKEFFRVSLGEIVEAVHSKHGEVQFTMKAEAIDYRKTQAIITEEGKSSESEPSEVLYDEILGV